MRFTPPSERMEPDVHPVAGARVEGWTPVLVGYGPRAVREWTMTYSHGGFDRPGVPTRGVQGPKPLYSTPEKALRAYRYLKEDEFGAQLAQIDEMIAAEIVKARGDDGNS